MTHSDRVELDSVITELAAEREALRQLHERIKRLPNVTAVFSIHERRLRFVFHPDADEYVLVAGFGEGNGLWTEAAHEVCLCMDEMSRQRLIRILQRGPEGIHDNAKGVKE